MLAHDEVRERPVGLGPLLKPERDPFAGRALFDPHDIRHEPDVIEIRVMQCRLADGKHEHHA